MTLDGKIADTQELKVDHRRGRQEYVHGCAAVMLLSLWKGTLETDDPRLTVRHKGYHPARIAFSSDNKILQTVIFSLHRNQKHSGCKWWR